VITLPSIGGAAQYAPAANLEPHSLICFSPLCWNFVFQRPQHLMSRFARERRVIFWEAPEAAAPECTPALGVRVCAESGVVICTPSLAEGMSEEERETALKILLDDFLARERGPFVRWYYTPMMLPFSRHVEAAATLYDCSDEFSGFRFAQPQLLALEDELFEAADIVFTGGYSLFEAKKSRHPNVHPFPSSVDRAHFALARAVAEQPIDQVAIPGPRFGFYGVVDERMDLDLIASVAGARPDWSLVILGTVKMNQAELPRRHNIFYLGGRDYEELPLYLGGWDVALMPFAINEATRFISPTKMPEYLAGGRPVVSTPIADMIRHYGDMEGVVIADGADAFVAGCERALELARGPEDWLEEVDAKLANLSWDTTFARMSGLVAELIRGAPRGPNFDVGVLPVATNHEARI
jgi:UDP-galactopyranose mutase